MKRVGKGENLKKNFYCFQAKYIAQCMEEIKLELRQENVAVKANAVAKLTYVSLGHTRLRTDNYYAIFFISFLIVSTYISNFISLFVQTIWFFKKLNMHLFYLS